VGVGSHSLRADFRPAGPFRASSGGAAHDVVSGHTLTVTTLADGGPGSLREALAVAAGGDTVTFADGLGGTLALTSGELAVAASVVIAGPGAGVLAVDAGYGSRVLEVPAGATASVSGLTLTRGAADSGGVVANGGTLLLAGAELSAGSAWGPGGGLANAGVAVLRGVTVSGNYAAGPGGGVYNAGQLDLAGGLLYGNVSSDGGGAAYNAAGAAVSAAGVTVLGNGALVAGGGLYNAGAATLAASALAADSSAAGGGAYNSGSLALSACAVYNNGATDGGGIYNAGGALSLSNTTLAQNSASGDGGGLWTAGPAGLVALASVTVAYNTAALYGGAGRGGGLFAASGLPALYNTLVADNFNYGASGGGFDDVYGALSGAGGYDLVGDGTGMTGLVNGANGNQVGSAAAPLWPALGPLQDNGGPTPTMALLAVSPARAAGGLDFAAATDQRGEARVVDGFVDIGAYQTQDYGL
jgi:hypothetical protein